MNRRNSLLILMFSFSFFSFSVKAQDEQLESRSDTVALKLSQALDNALHNNSQLQQSKIDALIAKEQSREADAAFLPQLNFNYSAVISNDPLNAFGFKLKQQRATQADFNPVLLNDPGITHNYYAELSFNQPILNLDAIFSRASARSHAKMKELSRQRRQEYLRLQVAQTYLQLGLSYKSYAVVQDAVKTSTSFLKRAKDMYQRGLIQQADLLEAEAFHLKMLSQLQQAETAIINTSDQLSLLMGKESAVVYQVDTIHWSFPTVSIADLSNRTDLLAYRAGIQSAKKNVIAQKMRFLPRLNAFGSYQFNDKRAFKFNRSSYLLGLNLSWQLFSGTQNIHKVRSALLQRDKAVSMLSEAEQKSRIEYDRTKRQYTDLELEKKQVALMVQQTQLAYRMQQDRYEQGLSSTSDLLRIQSQLSQQRLGYASVQFKQNLTIAYLRFITSTQE
ncbi:MAG: TolC family protein [Bacteroidaceae bacterium]|nr:TolC family protein [Bacteroidaceae bacterium]